MCNVDCGTPVSASSRLYPCARLMRTVCGALRAVDQRRMLGPPDSDRGAAFPTGRGAYIEHYHGERNYQGLDNRLISGSPAIPMTSCVRRRQRLGGLLNVYDRAA